MAAGLTPKAILTRARSLDGDVVALFSVNALPRRKPHGKRSELKHRASDDKVPVDFDAIVVDRICPPQRFYIHSRA